MDKWRNILWIGLVVQLLLVVGANLARTDYGTFKPQETLLAFDRKAVDGIRIEQPGNPKLQLKKAGGQWQVTNLNNFKADQKKVENFLNTISDLKKGWPVATRISAAKRFKVSQDDFEGKVVLAAEDETVGTLYAGSSPSFRRVHVRNEKEDAIYLVKIDSQRVDATPGTWIDTTILHQNAADIERLELPEVILMRKDDHFRVKGMDRTTEVVVDEEAQRLIRQVAELPISMVLGEAAKPEYHLDAPVLTYTLRLSFGESQTYVFSKAEEESEYILKPSHRKEYFKVKNWVVDDIMAFDRSKLLQTKNAEDTATEADTSQQKPQAEGAS